jgi:hypothetical protein
MTTKLFSIGGYSKLSNGQYKARFANTSVKARTALLERGGQTEVTFVELPQEMTKVQAAEYLLKNLQNIPAGAGVAFKHVLNGADEAEAETVVKQVVAAKKAAKPASKTKSADAEEAFVTKVMAMADEARAKSKVAA